MKKRTLPKAAIVLVAMAAIALVFLVLGENTPRLGNAPGVTPTLILAGEPHYLYELEMDQLGILENGYALFLENATGCAPGKKGSLEIKILTPSGGTLSSSKLWFGSFDAKLGNQTKKISIQAINGISRDDVYEECFFGSGLKEIKNVLIGVT